MTVRGEEICEWCLRNCVQIFTKLLKGGSFEFEMKAWNGKALLSFWLITVSFRSFCLESFQRKLCWENFLRQIWKLFLRKLIKEAFESSIFFKLFKAFQELKRCFWNFLKLFNNWKLSNKARKFSINKNIKSFLKKLLQNQVSFRAFKAFKS